MSSLTEIEIELDGKIAKMRQCPALIAQMLKLAKLSIEAYQEGRNSQITLHFSDGLIRRVRKEDWDYWTKSA